VSLWPVVDESTAVLMQRFYEQLKQKPAIEALRDAQLALIKGNGTAEPLFWAPFMLVGDWR
jgi:CHAT domain-containing protein